VSTMQPHPAGDIVQSGILLVAAALLGLAGVQGLRGKPLRVGSDDIGTVDPYASVTTGWGSRAKRTMYVILAIVLVRAAIRLLR
jgi:hypothetical protein